MARQHLPRRHGRRLPHRRRHLRLDEHGRRLGHGELDQAREPRSTAADARRPLAHDGQSADRPERRPHPADRCRLCHPPRHPRYGDRAPRQPRVHHHQALPAHRSWPRHRPTRRRRQASSLQSLQALFRLRRRSARAKPQPTRRKRSASISSTSPARMCRKTDGIELSADEVNALVAEAAENFAYADSRTGSGRGDARSSRPISPKRALDLQRRRSTPP